MSELWRAVIGYEAIYEVSNFGRIKRIGKAKSAIIGRILKPSIGTHDYLIVTLSVNNVHKKHSVHRLVLAAFDKPMPRHFDARHKDGTRTNNHIDNLQWGTRSENMMDAIRHGRTNRGIKNPSVKLNEEKVRAIRIDTRSQPEIAKEYGVGQSVISRIKARKAWDWIE
jgi:hypothetical protein